MPAFICTTCGCQYPNSDTPPVGCLICQDDRQYVNPAGQAWTTLPAMRTDCATCPLKRICPPAT